MPPASELDLYDGRAWLGVVPFHMTNVAPRFVAAIPGLSAFPELNVRTYVSVGDRPGVYFFGLDAGNPIAVGAARTMLNLPYFSGAMTVEVGQDGQVRYLSTRSSQPPAEFAARYRGLGDRRPLESAETDIGVNTMALAAGIRLPSMAPLLHFSKRQGTVTWTPERIG